MNNSPRPLLFSALFILTVIPLTAQQDVLPSWNDGPTKQSIIDFVSEVTKQGGSNFVPEDRGSKPTF